MKRILVTGASGNLGRAVVNALRTSGVVVRAASRGDSKIAPGAGIERVLFDFETRSTHEAALKNVDAVFLVAPPLDSDAPDKLSPVIDLARSSGVSHVVFNSALGVDAVEEAPLRILERYLMGSGVAFTILRPNFFMENFSTGFLSPMVKEGNISLAAGDGKTSFISVADIAAVAATVLVKGLVSKEYNLTGPEALDHNQVAAAISKASGQAIAYQPITNEMMLKGLRSSGMPESAVQYVGVLYDAVRAGYTATVTPDVESVTLRKPVTFESFVRQHAAAWA